MPLFDPTELFPHEDTGRVMHCSAPAGCGWHGAVKDAVIRMTENLITAARLEYKSLPWECPKCGARVFDIRVAEIERLMDELVKVKAERDKQKRMENENAAADYDEIVYLRGKLGVCAAGPWEDGELRKDDKAWFVSIGEQHEDGAPFVFKRKPLTSGWETARGEVLLMTPVIWTRLNLPEDGS